MEENRYDLHADPRLDHLIGAFRQHPDLRDAAKPTAIGLVVSLLRWTAQHAPTGDLSSFAPQVLADAVDWEGDAPLMLHLLQDAGFLNAKMQFVGISRMLDAKKGFLKWAFEETDEEYQ